MRRSLLLVVLLTVPLLASPVHGAPESLVADYSVAVDGAVAHGLVAKPAGEPRGLVVVVHGYGHDGSSHRGHLQHLAEQGFVAVAMDFRGPRSGFPLAAGAEDTIAATLDLLAAHPVDDVYLYSVSMGTAVAGIVLADPRMDGVFDYWVNNEGLAMLAETWAGATAISPSGNPTAVAARAAIETETGGTPATAAEAYAWRSAALRVPEFTGLKGVVLTHGLNDGLVPHNQGREMAAALRAAGIPSDFYTVVRGEPCQEGTTLTGYVGVNCTGVAGHGTESNDRHTLTKLSFALLDEVVNGTYGPITNAERVVDEGLGTLP